MNFRLLVKSAELKVKLIQNGTRNDLSSALRNISIISLYINVLVNTQEKGTYHMGDQQKLRRICA